MSGMSSFYSAVSGVKGHLFSMGIVGNNISNVNTNGFKASRVTFREALVQTLRGGSGGREYAGGVNPTQVGLGMEVGSVDTRRSQGMIQSTGIETDLAIDGEGYFIIENGQRQYFTRSGNFVFDADGYLTVSGTGALVQGWMANSNGVIPSGAPLSSLRLPFGEKVPGQETTEVSFSCNLDAAASTSTASLASAGSTGITVVSGTAANGAGGQHQITITGANATRSTALGANLTNPGALTGAETLASLGVTDASDFTLTVDGGDAVPVLGLTLASTVNDVINAINNSGLGITAEIDSGEIRLTRDYYGDGTFYNIATSLGVAGNISRQVFGAAAGSAFQVNSGTSSTLEAVDTFTPTGKAAMTPVRLTLEADSADGLITGLSGVGNGGVTILADQGLAAGNCVIDTDATEHLASVLVYDSLGHEHTLNMTFTRSAEQNLWYWDASLDGSEVITGGGSGTIRFNSDGSFRSWESNDGSTAMSLEPRSGAGSMELGFWTGTASAFDGISQFSSPFSVSAISQDGYGMGNLAEVTFDRSGKIKAIFSNGILKEMGQVVLAKFNNPDGLERVGGNLYMATPGSGESIVGAAGGAVAASVISNSLEMSNVDLSEEFVNMIVAQRGFQANARVITTGDEMLTELMNVKR